MGGQIRGQRVQAPADSARLPQSVCAGEEERPRCGFAHIRACPPGLLRDEESVGLDPIIRPLVRRVGAPSPALDVADVAVSGLWDGWDALSTPSYLVSVGPFRKSAAICELTAGQTCLSFMM